MTSRTHPLSLGIPSDTTHFLRLLGEDATIIHTRWLNSRPRGLKCRKVRLFDESVSFNSLLNTHRNHSPSRFLSSPAHQTSYRIMDRHVTIASQVAIAAMVGYFIYRTFNARAQQPSSRKLTLVCCSSHSQADCAHQGHRSCPTRTWHCYHHYVLPKHAKRASGTQ